MRKILVITLLAISALSLAACGDSKSDKLVYMMWGDSAERAAVDKFLAKFAEKYPKIGLPTVIHTDSLSYWDKFQVMVAANEVPDVYYMGVEELKSYMKQDVIMDLTPLIEKDSQELDMADFYKGPMEAFNVDGKQYGIPKDFATLVLYYNIDMFKKAGVELPDEDWTWLDLLNAAKRLTISQGNNTQVYGFMVEFWASWLPAWVRSNGGKYMSDDGKTWVFGLDPWVEKSAQAYQFLADMISKHKVSPDYSLKKQLGDTGSFASQKVAMCAYGRWAVLKFKDIKDFRWGIAEIPKSPNTGKRVSTLFTASYAIAKNTKRKEDAWTLVKFLTSKEGQVDTARSGMAIPSRKSIAESKDFLESEEVNQHQVKLGNKIDHRVNLKALDYALVPNSHPNWLKVRTKLDEWFQTVFLGNDTALSKMKEKQKAFEAILNEK